MKKTSIFFALCLISGFATAQPSKNQGGKNDGKKLLAAERKFEILVTNVEKQDIIQSSNERFLQLQSESKERALGAFGSLVWSAYSSSIVQKTVNATSNLVSLGINYLTEAIKGERQQWYRMAQEQCHFNQVLTSESSINDFYSAPSVKGSMDPENLKFEGFGCKNYIELSETPGEGVNVFYIFCKMRRDSIGLSHIVNHSKFQVEIDTLIFIPKYCNLPNDPTGNAENRFSFEKRKDLKLTLKARLYASWMNQATMITNDEQLGEFTVHVKIDATKLDSLGQFIYKKNDPAYQKLISIEGDSYIVPRSFTGTTDAQNYQPSWGTGQYRIEMEVSEDCAIVDSYYQIREAGNGKAVAYADATPGKKKWDKAKWKTEWKAMTSRRKGDSVWKNIWDCIVRAYKGSGWTATFTDPIATSLYSYETTKLNEAFTNLRDKLFSSDEGAPASTPAQTTSPASSATQAANGGNKPAGAKPAGGNMPPF